MANPALFGNRISPACEYCAHSRLAADKKTLLCAHGGVVPAHHHCTQFLYAPLKRVPRRPPKLPSFSPEDFKL